ncbi:MAG TPA: galactose oxidase early set domain-containing protein [Gemmatimonadales bacterium]|nr:galactose oxidase early set domain-containing protein [Gemmatimonadales bacterium]
MVRVYHSTTALLPDGRVLSTGSGDGGGVTQQFIYEIFSPPYLFKGPRPTYNLASTSMHYGQPFTVATPNAAAIQKVTVIRLASSTHAFDMGQRLNTLAFQAAADGQSLVLTPPSAGRIAPPGPYMLFILNDRGVPSVAQTILLSQ